jgi:hypothetical protein
MTDLILYPCGVDLIGVALRDEHGDQSVFKLAEQQFRPPYHEYTKVMPYVISWTELIGAGFTCKIVVRPSRTFRLETVHATGPCELLSVRLCGQEIAPRETERGHRRWAYVQRMCQVGQDIKCTIFCVPGLFMLQAGCERKEAKANKPGGEFIDRKCRYCSCYESEHVAPRAGESTEYWCPGFEPEGGNAGP